MIASRQKSNRRQSRGSNTTTGWGEMPGDHDQVYLAQDTPLPRDPPAALCLLPPGLCSASNEEERRRGRPPAGLQGLQAGTAGEQARPDIRALSWHSSVLSLGCPAPTWTC